VQSSLGDIDPRIVRMLAAHENRLTGLSNENISLKEANAKHSKDITSLNEANTRLKKTIKNKEKRFDEVVTALNKKIMDNNDQKVSLETMNRENEEQVQEIKRLNSKINELGGQLDALDDEVTNIREEKLKLHKTVLLQKAINTVSAIIEKTFTYIVDKNDITCSLEGFVRRSD